METTTLSQRLIQFMNALPTTGDIVEWIYGFREALQQLLGPGSVHRIGININFNYGNPHTPAESDSMYAISYCTNKQLPMEMFFYLSDIDTYVKEKAAKLLDQMGTMGVSLDEYQTPLCFNYYDRDYLGSIFLLRYRNPQPIPACAVEIMEELHPFIFFSLSSAVVRRAYTDPSQPFFPYLWSEQCMALDLSEKERQVFMLELLAYPRAEIARRLNISPHSINKYVQNINRKAGTSRLVEIFVRRFDPDFEEGIMNEIRTSRKTERKEDLVAGLHEEKHQEQRNSITLF